MIGTRHAMIHFRNLLGRYPELVRLTIPGLEVYHKNKPHDTSYIVPEWLIFEFLHQLHDVEIKQRVNKIGKIPPLDHAEKITYRARRWL